MPDNSVSKDKLHLKIITPEGQFCFIECDSVVFQIKDDEKGRGAGSYGVRKGHARSVFAVENGDITAYKEDKPVLFASVGDGFALVEENILSVTTEKAFYKK